MALPGLSLLIMQLLGGEGWIYVGKTELARNFRLKDAQNQSACLPLPAFPALAGSTWRCQGSRHSLCDEGSATRIWVDRVRDQAVLALESRVNVNNLKLEVSSRSFLMIGILRLGILVVYSPPALFCNVWREAKVDPGFRRELLKVRD